ncbi:Unknown protein, partial [Striga hermonthica]
NFFHKALFISIITPCIFIALHLQQTHAHASNKSVKALTTSPRSSSTSFLLLRAAQIIPVPNDNPSISPMHLITKQLIPLPLSISFVCAEVNKYNPLT